jgi:hypothetical protein
MENPHRHPLLEDKVTITIKPNSRVEHVSRKVCPFWMTVKEERSSTRGKEYVCNYGYSESYAGTFRETELKAYRGGK